MLMKPIGAAITRVGIMMLVWLIVFPSETTFATVAAMVSATVSATDGGMPRASDSDPSRRVGADDFSQLFENPLGQNDLAAANQLTGSVKLSEWLGPLAPIAISPFFGIALLAGISQFGSEALPFNEFISNNPILSNPATFWVFLLLTVLTSLPRFTKVSKPAAQAIDQLETYAAIITIVLLRVLASSSHEAAGVAPVAMQAGVFALSADVLMSVAAIVNIVVINTIKFFFEVSVWLIPFPMVDAALEIANKSVCAALMAVYAYSPAWATVINMMLFLVCLVAFRWAHRRTVYLRTLLLDPVLAMVSDRYARPGDQLTVFPQHSLGPFSAKTKLVMRRHHRGWLLKQHRFLLPAKTIEIADGPVTATMTAGLISNRIEFSDGVRLLFSRRHGRYLPALAEELRLGLDGHPNHKEASPQMA